MRANKWLVVGGTLSVFAALLHIAIIFGGPDWYRFFGAGEAMARADARGSSRPDLITACIAAILFLWAAYAFSGAGLIRRLPLLRTALVVIAVIYLIRALGALVLLVLGLEPLGPFIVWSTLIVLICGLAYAIGTWTAWPRLRR